MFCNEKQCVLHYKSMYFATQTTAFIYILRYKTLNTQRKSTISTTYQLECYAYLSDFRKTQNLTNRHYISYNSYKMY